MIAGVLLERPGKSHDATVVASRVDSELSDDLFGRRGSVAGMVVQMAKKRRQYSNGNDAVVVVSLPVNSLRFEAQ